jgi:hypothetical protein
MEQSVIIGSLGLVFLLVAFLLNLTKYLTSESATYNVMNLIGASLCCYASYLIGFWPFIILEGIWAIVALANLVKNLRK